MNKLLSIVKGSGKASSFLLSAMLLLLMLLSTEQASAYDFMWDSDKYVFRGMGSSVSIELPIYDKDGRDMWAIDGYVYVKAAGKQEVTLLHYKSEGDISGGAKNNDAKFDTSIGGVLKIKDTSGSWVRLSNTQQTVKIYSSGDHFTAVLEWEAPYEWRGMDLEFRVKVHGDQNAWKEWNKEWTKKVSALMSPPATIEPSIMTSMLTNEAGHAREISVMWQIAASQVTGATAYYKANGVDKSTKLANETFGTIYVPSDQLVDGLYVKVNYKDNENHDVTGVDSKPYDVPYFHQAKNVKTKLLTNGNVELTWEVDNPDRNDIMKTDFWLIQRNTSGSSKDDDANWITIGQISFQQGEASYKFPDNTMLNAYEGKTVYYRVQRASVADSWGYSTQSGAGKGVLLQKLALPDILSATAIKSDEWGQNNRHKVSLSWETNQNVTDIETPTFCLRNRDDWDELCIIVSKGFNTVNVVMMDDIDISGSELMLGEIDMPYCGTFDGKGHTLTVNYNTTEQYSGPFRYVGTGVVIKNLHTAGTIQTSAKFAGGIVARVDGTSISTTTATIDRCWSSVEINSTVNGDGTHGGIVAHQNTGSLTISNSLFDGKLLGNLTFNCGGIVGWRENNSKLNLSKVLFAPQSVTINTSGSYTFFRNSTNVSYYQMYDCFCTQRFGTSQGSSVSSSAQDQQAKLGDNWTVQDNKCVPLMVKDFFSIKSSKDWDAFAKLVNNGNTAINAVLEADVDISHSELMVGTETNPYSGTFNGCGHTLKVGYNTSKQFTAPFAYVSSATFKNLHVTGSVKGGMHTAGLIGKCMGNGRITIASCCVSADITFSGEGSTSPHGGGFIGHCCDAYCKIQNCRFDGSFTVTSQSNSYAGAFVGWEHTKKSYLENNLECGTYNNIKYTGFCFRYIENKSEKYGNGGDSNNMNNYSFQNWGEMGSGYANVQSLSTSELVIKLGSGWTMQDGKCMPVMDTSTAGEQYKAYVWDHNAQMTLHTDKYVNGELRYTEERDITEDERKAGRLDLDLTSPCVDYGFRIEVVRSNSQLNIGDKTADVMTSTYEIPVRYPSGFVSGDTIAIASREDWEAFVDLVAQYRDEDMKSYNVVMTKDIDLGDSQAVIGDITSTNYTKFRGSFDGRGHTLTVNYKGHSAPFHWLENATVKNLHVAGSISETINTAGIAERAISSTIENCRVSAQLNITQSSIGNRPIIGGIIEEAERGDIIIKNCLFDGAISTQRNGTYLGGLVGILSRNANVEIINSVFSPSTVPSVEKGGTMIVSNVGYDNVQITNCYYTEVLSELQGTDASSFSLDEMLENLGKPWTLYKGGLSPWEAQSTPHTIFYFDNNVKLDSVRATNLHNVVQLKWYTNGGDADYFDVYRRDLTAKTDFQLIEGGVQESGYTDRTVKAHRKYEYMVKAIVQCEGVHIDSVSCKGHCDDFGRVSGFVRMPNGTGIGGVEVKATPDPSLSGVGVERIVTTDETGYFLIDTLYYVPDLGAYTLQVQVTGEGPQYTNATINFTEDKNEYTNTVLALREYYVFTGKVLYDGTSIPVPGAQFKLDGKPLYNYQQKRVETDNQGAFTINIPAGPHKIQVEKEGHVFENDGYFIDLDNKKDSTEHNWQRNIADVYLWDQTRVILRGRMVGGEIQGSKPLGQSLSTNNLGNNLKMVMQLEGDNTSWIVRDPQNLSITERKDSLRHGAINHKTGEKKDMTRWEMTRHNITIHPDDVTGEYEIKLFPVKYKITEQSCTGYPTLFQDGKVGETLDLTYVGNDSIVEYKCVYHTPVKLDVKQFNLSGETFFGDSYYLAEDIDNSVDTVTIWIAPTDSTDARYVLKHPVFMSNASYLFNLQAQEEYWFENRSDTLPDIVPLHEGTVYFHNDLVGNNVTDSVKLDSIGRGYYQFIPKNTTFLGNDESSLRTLDINLLYDGVYYDVKPFNGGLMRAYVMGAVPAASGRQVVSKGGTHLIDILRDPPGSGSSAYIEKGSKTKYAYTLAMDGKIGINMEKVTGSGANFYQGLWGGVTPAGTTAGTISSAKTTSEMAFSFGVKCGGTWVYSYEMTTTERIQTSSNSKWVGPKADIYIGMTDNIIVGDAVAVRMVPEKQFEKLKLRTNGKIQLDGHKYDIKDGTVQVLATGVNAKKEKVYLISDEVFNYYAEFNSEFMHTGEYIEKELIPNLLKMRNERLLPMGTDEKSAKTMADNDSRNVYISLVDASNPEFGYHASLASDGKAKYKVIRPSKISSNIDEIEQYNNEIITWAGFLAKNEKEKVQAPYNADLVKNFDFDGAANVQYSESFTTSDDYSRYLRFEPFSLSLNNLPDQILSQSLLEASPLMKFGKDENDVTIDVFPGSGATVKVKVKPVFTLDINDKNSKSESWSKKAGFTLSAANKSNLSVSVYRSKVNKNEVKDLVNKGDADAFLLYSKNTLDHVRGGATGLGVGLNWMTYASNDEQMYGNFIFVTNGGATVAPWEDERKTKFYQPGTVHDQKTVKIDQLRIWAEQSIVSNVPYGEPARFTIYMCNESPTPDKASPIFVMGAPDNMNQHGARIMYSGNVLNGSGYNVALSPGVVVAKEIEVFAGEGFDYEDLGIQLYDANDIPQAVTVKLSAHFVPSAGNIAISTPGDKWVVNTESPYDKKELSYYMPVRIDGFNVNQRNFDHIELQYKLSTQGDKDWVNICSYYKSDSLMALASGTCKLIENDGYITASFFGEKDPVEQYYDLRAVVYCRNGNGFLTSSSPILTGVKDTRRPQLFGTPKPVNGILGIGDDITVAFSEPIASNYLSEVNNFEVLGLTNSSNITQGTCLRFNGGDGARTHADRNFSAKSFTLDVMINPDEHTLPMGLFKHGTMRKNLQAGLSGDNRLMVILNKEVFLSDRPVEFSGLHQVSYVFDVDIEHQRTNISFYDGNTKIGTGVYEGLYDGVSNLVLGSAFVLDTPLTPGSFESEEYRGTMLELRLWNKALSEGEITQYAKKRLTGYESGLLDNFALNEGKGTICYNKAVGGTDLQLVSATWSLPAGLSMKLDGEKGVVLNDSAFVRTNTQDYTLMFWFRTLQSDGTLLSNGPALNESQWKNHFNIGLEEGRIYYRNGKFEVKNSIDKRYNDGAWHHMAVTVNRARNVGNLYVDQNLVQSFAVDTLGGILGGTLAAGITYEDAYTTSGGLAGNIDELALYEMTLPVNVIKDYASMMPSGREMGTLVYLPFSRSEKQKDNTQRLVASGESIKQTRDNQGNYSTRMDVIVPDSVMDKVSDRENYAPIDNTGQRENLNYSYVTDNQNLLINIDEPAQNMEKTHVYITVRDVADLNGNLLESPVMMDLYVYRNPLRWSEKRLNIETYYGYGSTVDVVIKNMSGKTHTYYIENQPLWITPSKTSGTIGATDEETITLDISPYINIGDFDEMLNLVSEEGLSEVLPIHIKVRGESPDWAISESLKKKNITMNMVARVKIDGIVADDPEDIIGVFGNNHEPLGVAHLNVDNTANANEPLAFITVYNNNLEQHPLRFEYYDCTTGRISVLKREDGEELVFYPDSILGSTDNPIMLVNSGEEVQMMQLRKGWNWVSFYMKPEKNTISNLLNRSTKWEVGDAVEVLGTNGFYEISYKGIPNPDNPTRINYFWDNGNDSIELDATRMYRIYSCSDKTAYLSGQRYDDFIQVSPGWNRIAYISHLNLPIANALADYTAKATVGDIIKSQSEFSMLVEDTQGNRMWKGTLTHLTVGQGYMLKHLGNNDFIFYYPSYEGSTRYGSVQYKAPRYENNTGSSMNIVARTAGVDLQEGDCLVAYNGAELCGVAEKSDDDLFFLSVADYGSNDLSFAIQRGEELIALSSNQMTYQTNGVIGTVNEPTVINFAEVSHQLIGEWYDLQGRKLDKRPQTPGIYIFNGQKILIK